MKIERRFTTEETGAYGALAFRTTALGDPQSGRVGGLQPRATSRCPRAGARSPPTCWRRSTSARPACPAALKRVAREGRARLPVALGSRRGEARRAARGRADRRRDHARGRSSTGWPAPGPTGAGRAATSRPRPTPAPTTTRCATCWRRRWAAPNSPAVVQHRAALGLRHRRAGAGAFLRRLPSPASWSRSTSAYEHPQPHACFIQSVADDLVNDGGIMDLWTREARLFKYGSGTGTNFSSLRGRERAAGGRRQVVGADELPQDRRPRGRARSSRAAPRGARRRW